MIAINILKRYIPLRVKIRAKVLLYDMFFYRPALYEYKKLPRQNFVRIKSVQKNIHVLLIMPHLLYGGVESLTYNVISQLDKKKYTIFIACTNREGEQFQKFKEVLNGRVYDLSKINKNLLKQREYLEKLIREKRIDIVHLSNNEPYYFITPFLTRLVKPPLIINWLHCDELYFDVHRLGYKRFSSFIDATIVVNNNMKKFLVNKEHIPSKRVVTITNGVDPEIFNPKKFTRKNIKKKLNISTDLKVVAYIARLASEKLPLEYIHVASDIFSRYKKVIFLVIGEGYYKKSMIDLAKKEGLEKNIFFLASDSDIAEILSCVDILISTSISEGFGMSVAEAMAMKVAVIAYECGGVSELVNHEINGYLAEPYSSEKLADYAIKLLTDKKLQAKMGKQARDNIIKNYTIKQTVRKISKLYNTII